LRCPRCPRSVSSGYAGMEDYVWIEHDIDERLIALGFEPHAAPLAETARFVRETGAKAE